MSRSFRKNPIVGVAGDSDKRDKQSCNRKNRRWISSFLSTIGLENFEEEDYSLPLHKESGNVWNWSKDGKMRLFKDLFTYYKDKTDILRKTLQK